MKGESLLEAMERIAERQRRVVEMTRHGMSASEIAAVLRTTARTVARDRSAAGVAQTLAPPLTVDQLRIARQLLDDGASVAEVGRTLGCSPNTIRRHFPGAGWTREQVYEHVSLVRRLRQVVA